MFLRIKDKVELSLKATRRRRSHFTLVLPDLTYEKGVEDSRVPEIAEYLDVSDSTYLRKNVSGNLEKNGFLEKSRLSRAAFYKTNPEMVEIK